MSKNKKSASLTKSASKKTSGKAKKADEEFFPAIDDEELDALDHMIEELAHSKGLPTTKTTSTNNKRKPKEDLIDIRDFQELEAGEDTTKKQARKDNRHWTAPEAALLKLLVTGCKPIGKNYSGVYCCLISFLIF